MLRGLLRGGAAVAAGTGLLLATNPLARSLAVRVFAYRRLRSSGQGGVVVTTAIDRGAWIRLGLAADLSRPLSSVAGRPLEAMAYAHFGGFGGRSFAAFMDPASAYYQAWLGAYVVRAPDGPPFGYDEYGQPRPEAAYQLLEADQRLVLRSCGLLPLDDPRPRVRLLGELEVDQVVAWAANWVRVRGSGDTAAAFERGSWSASRRARWLYGVVPDDLQAPVRDFHPVTSHAALWYRYDPMLGATVAKFYVYCEYVDDHGEHWQRGREIVAECEALLDGIRFDRRSAAGGAASRHGVWPF